MNSAPATSRSRALSPEELQQFGAEIDALRARVQADLGERDAKYIRKVVKVQRWIEVTGRALLVAAGWFPPVWLIGTLMLGIAKILDNMEIGNTGNLELMIQTATFSPGTPPEFIPPVFPVPFSLPPGSGTTMRLQFRPSQAVQYAGKVILTRPGHAVP